MIIDVGVAFADHRHHWQAYLPTIHWRQGREVSIDPLPWMEETPSLVFRFSEQLPFKW